MSQQTKRDRFRQWVGLHGSQPFSRISAKLYYDSLPLTKQRKGVCGATGHDPATSSTTVTKLLNEFTWFDHFEGNQQWVVAKYETVRYAASREQQVRLEGGKPCGAPKISIEPIVPVLVPDIMVKFVEEKRMNLEAEQKHFESQCAAALCNIKDWDHPLLGLTIETHNALNKQQPGDPDYLRIDFRCEIWMVHYNNCNMRLPNNQAPEPADMVKHLIESWQEAGQA